jgi:hypothetical protein
MENRGRSILIVSLLYGWSLTLCATAAYADEAAVTNSGFDWWKLVGLSGAAIAFLAGLQQYRSAQQWKRAEFVANEMKELQGDTKATMALSMIDWESRDFKLKPGDSTPTRVTREMQCRALLPHTIASPSQQSDTQSSAARDGAQLKGFSEAEADIRDCFDSLLDWLDRFGSYLQTSLLTAKDMRPYIGYYVNDIAAPTADPDEALWCVCFLTYVHFYHFDGIVWLFREFGHDISPDGPIFTAFMNNVRSDRKGLATDLQSAARREQHTASDERIRETLT